MRALDSREGGYLPPRGTYLSLEKLLHDYGFGLIFVDQLARTGRLLWVGSRFLVQ